MARILGSPVDEQTRCVHYQTPLDVVAIRFKCCNEFYPCHLCHDESAGHPAKQWTVSERDTDAVLCGACGSLLSIREYLTIVDCPWCAAPFNPGCHLHTHLYFETEVR